MSEQQHRIKWHDSGREPQCESNPKYPEGVDADCAGGAKIVCTVMLPYPAPRCGVYTVYCEKCHVMVGITTAGRPDDPRSATLACKLN